MQRIELEAFPDRDERSEGAPTVPRLDSDHPQSIDWEIGSRVRIMQFPATLLAILFRLFEL